MTESSPKVSIVLPTYNGAKYIRRSIDSCLNQTYENIELIVVDDGSTDKTQEIIKSYGDNRIKYIRHEKNRGLPLALNTGFEKATGEYLTWTSDDNYYAKEAIEKMLSFLKEKNCSFVYCDYYNFIEDDLSNQKIIRLPDPPGLENGNYVGACFLYSKKVRDVVGDYDPVTELAEDYDYWIRVSKKFSMCHLDEPLYFFRVHKGSLSAKKSDDVKLAGFLVRLKNDLLDVNQVTDLFIDFIAQKRGGSFKFKKFLTKSMFSEKIIIILGGFKIGRISFENAKLNLKNIIERESQNLQLPVADKFYQAAKEVAKVIVPSAVRTYLKIIR